MERLKKEKPDLAPGSSN